jgi:hypothetical protein
MKAIRLPSGGEIELERGAQPRTEAPDRAGQDDGSEAQGKQDTARGDRVRPLRIEVGLIDDARPEDGRAQYARMAGREIVRFRASAATTPRIGIAPSAAGQFRKTRTRPAPAARPFSLTWYSS